MGKVRKIIFGGLAGLTVLSLVWVNSTPRELYKTEINDILARRQQEWDLAQKNYANDQTQNLFLNPDLHPSWALKTESIQPGELDKSLVELIKLNPFDPKQNQDEYLVRQGKTRADLQAARQKFRGYVPKIVQATNLPYFVAPATPPGKMTAKTVVPNFLGMRRVAQACAFEASLDVQEGKPDEAIPLGLAGIKLGYAAANAPGVLIYEMIAVALQNIGVEPIYEALLTQKLKPESLKTIIAELPRYTQPPENFSRALEMEVLMVHNSMDDLSTPALHMLSFGETRPTTGDWILDGVLRKTGAVAREMRIYDNCIYPLIESHGDKVVVLKQEDWLKDELSGTGGILNLLLIPNTMRSHYIFNLLRTRLSALRIMAALQLYHSQKKAYPENLEALKEVGLDPIPQAEINKNTFSYSLNGGQPSLTLALEPAQAESAKFEVVPVVDGKFQFWAPKP